MLRWKQPVALGLIVLMWIGIGFASFADMPYERQILRLACMANQFADHLVVLGWQFEGVTGARVDGDMLGASKALGGGIPLSAVVARADLLETWGAGARVSTQSGNVLACTAENNVLETLTAPGFLDGVNERGHVFVDGWKKPQLRYDLIGQIDARGIYIGVELVENRETRKPAPEQATFILRECVKAGMVFEKGGYFHNRFQLIPPLTIRSETIDRALEIFDNAFAAAEKQFGPS